MGGVSGTQGTGNVTQREKAQHHNTKKSSCRHFQSTRLQHGKNVKLMVKKFTTSNTPGKTVYQSLGGHN